MATSFIAPGTNVSIDSHIVIVALRIGLFATEDIVKAKCDRLLKELKRSEMENEELKKLILENGAAKNATTTCLLNMENETATIEIKKGLLSNLNA